MPETTDRSSIMRAVKSVNTKPEMAVRRIVHAMGYRYRLHRADLPGKPDLVFPARRSVIFVHGCWWHGHDCKRGARETKTNRDYWIAKIDRNRKRDIASKQALEALSWRPLIIWECEIRNVDELSNRLLSFLGRKDCILRRGDKRSDAHSRFVR
jgi:DNA mismatch endonuclease (patch repair protein)